MRLRDALNIADLRAIARGYLPKGLFEYIDRGTENETSLCLNRKRLDDARLLPSALVDVRDRSMATELFSRPQSMPIVIAPTAVAGLAWFDGEVELGRAARARNIPICVSTQTLNSIENIARSNADIWFQLYMWRDRELSYALLDRVAAVGVDTILLTVDSAVPPKREYNIRNGFGIPVRLGRTNVIDALLHPRWLCQVAIRSCLAEGAPSYANYPAEFRARISDAQINERVLLCDRLTWEDVRILRFRWKGRLVLKGIMTPSDARMAIDAGADGIVVSNHGARNMDVLPTVLDVLPAIADELGGRMTLLADSGVQRGSDIAKYLAAGADAVLVGRSATYGLASGGMAGAVKALDILGDELDRTMAMLGATTVSQLRGRLMPPAGSTLFGRWARQNTTTGQQT